MPIWTNASIEVHGSCISLPMMVTKKQTNADMLLSWVDHFSITRIISELVTVQIISEIFVKPIKFSDHYKSFQAFNDPFFVSVYTLYGVYCIVSEKRYE